MIPAFVEAIRAVQPVAFLMENVPGLVVGDRRRYLRSVLKEFDDMGFNLAYKIVKASDYGIPQKRRRLFVVGMRGRTFPLP